MERVLAKIDIALKPSTGRALVSESPTHALSLIAFLLTLFSNVYHAVFWVKIAKVLTTPTTEKVKSDFRPATPGDIEIIFGGDETPDVIEAAHSVLRTGDDTETHLLLSWP